MHRLLRLALFGIALGAWASSACAAGWSFTLDVPLVYTFDSKAINKPIPPNTGTANFTDRSSGDVLGMKLMVIAPFHVGVGYEDYSTVPNIAVSGFPGTGSVRLGIRMVDVMVDIPGRIFSLGLGYGVGTASVDINLPAAVPQTVAPLRRVNAQQGFAVIGVALRPRLDLHLAYHSVSVDPVRVSDSGGNLSALRASGQMVSAGVRLNF
jgi:hypothetical protein